MFRGPDGTEVQWSSRAHRKRVRVPAVPAGLVASAHPRLVDGDLFSIGAACFVYGGVASHVRGPSHTGIGITFFVGSLFFTSAAYLQYAEAANVQHDVDLRGAPPALARQRPGSPTGSTGWPRLVQLVGTVLFNISTFAALNHHLSTHQPTTGCGRRMRSGRSRS